MAVFVDDCHDADIAVDLDLVDNRWIPFRVDSEHHIGRPGGSGWPVADDTPWDKSATWYREVIIRYRMRGLSIPRSIAMWSMMGHYHHGTAEPELWDNDVNPAIPRYTEQFVKRVWPVFRSAGKRPKAAPYVMPIFSNNAYWMARTPEQRLSGVANLKKWLVDDLALPPDYWPMTTYPFCDPAPDGFRYLTRIVEIFGKENASRILSTDFKGPGHELELKESIIARGGRSGCEILEWQFEKCAEYGFAGWWIWAYQDEQTPDRRQGIRRADGQWKQDLLQTIKKQAKWRTRHCPLLREELFLNPAACRVTLNDEFQTQRVGTIIQTGRDTNSRSRPPARVCILTERDTVQRPDLDRDCRDSEISGADRAHT